MFLSKHASARFILDIYRIESLAFRTSLCTMYPKEIKELINIQNQKNGLRGFLLSGIVPDISLAHWSTLHLLNSNNNPEYKNMYIHKLVIRYINENIILIIDYKTLQAVLFYVTHLLPQPAQKSHQELQLFPGHYFGTFLPAPLAIFHNVRKLN